MPLSLITFRVHTGRARAHTGRARALIGVLEAEVLEAVRAKRVHSRCVLVILHLC